MKNYYYHYYHHYYKKGKISANFVIFAVIIRNVGGSAASDVQLQDFGRPTAGSRAAGQKRERECSLSSEPRPVLIS